MKTLHPHPLLDALLEQERLKNDTCLANELKTDPPQISKIRSGKIQVSDSFRVAVMRRFRWSLRRVDELAPPAEKGKS